MPRVRSSRFASSLLVATLVASPAFASAGDDTEPVAARVVSPGSIGTRPHSESEPALEALEEELRAAERAFAQTMADRDLPAFESFLAEQAVFFGGTTLRGKAAVVEAWEPYYREPGAPFSWEPETVAVLRSGRLGLSSGPVHDPDGNRIGTFNSIWQREPSGKWKIVFDKGCSCR